MDLREEFRAGWNESAERGGARDELRQFGAWLLGLPGALLRALAHYGRALLRISVALLLDALRGTPVLVGLLVRGLVWTVRAGLRASAAMGETAPVPAVKPTAKGTAPAAEDGADEETVEEEAQLPADVPAGPPGKRRKQSAPAPAKQATAKAPAAAPAPAGLGLPDVLERAVIGFIVLALAVTGLGMVGRYLGGLLAPYASGIIFGLVAVWILAATMVAPQAEEDQEDDADDEDDVEGGDEDPAENDHEMVGEQPEEIDPWPTLCKLIRKCTEEETAAGAGGFRDHKGRGVRLDDLLVVLQRKGVTEAVDRKALITLLDKAEIPHREQIKFRLDGKQKPGPGVHVDDLTKTLGYRPRLPVDLVPDLTPQPGPS